LSDIKRRLKVSQQKWIEIRSKIQRTRKFQSIPFYVSSLNKTFWYFEADCIRSQLSKIERLGTKIYDQIVSSHTFKREFTINAFVEEAITSAIYEGANTTRARAKQFITEKKHPKSKDEFMFVNNYKAMMWIKDNLDQETSEETILNIHGMVTKNTLDRDDENYAGRYRDDKVYIGDHEGVDYLLLPAVTNEVIQLITDNQRYIHPLIKGILAHYFIGYIHPFFDGNGRTARTLFYFEAMKNDLKFIELLSISAYLKQHGKRYERAFENAIEYELDLTYFIDFALDSLLQALETVQVKIKHLTKIWELKEPNGLSDFQVILLQKLALNKFLQITIWEYAADNKRSHERARQELKKLTSLDFIIESKVKKTLYYKINSKKLKTALKEI